VAVRFAARWADEYFGAFSFADLLFVVVVVLVVLLLLGPLPRLRKKTSDGKAIQTARIAPPALTFKTVIQC
jgi:hypothetical protein